MAFVPAAMAVKASPALTRDAPQSARKKSRRRKTQLRSSLCSCIKVPAVRILFKVEDRLQFEFSRFHILEVTREGFPGRTSSLVAAKERPGRAPGKAQRGKSSELSRMLIKLFVLMVRSVVVFKHCSSVGRLWRFCSKCRRGSPREVTGTKQCQRLHCQT